MASIAKTSGSTAPNAKPKTFQLGTATPLTGFNLDPSTGEIYQDTGAEIAHYGSGCPRKPNRAIRSTPSAAVISPAAMGVAVDGATHTVYVANSGSDDVAVFGDVRPIVTTGPEPTAATESEVTLTGHIDPAGRGDITELPLRIRLRQDLRHTRFPARPTRPPSNFTGPTDVTATITGLSPGTREHYRLVADQRPGRDRRSARTESFSSTQPPAIDGLVAEHLTATSADLEAQVNPNGLETTYRFEYGPTTATVRPHRSRRDDQRVQLRPGI